MTWVGRRALGLLYYESEDEKKSKSPGEVVLLLFFHSAAQLSFTLEEKFSQTIRALWPAQILEEEKQTPHCNIESHARICSQSLIAKAKFPPNTACRRRGWARMVVSIRSKRADGLRELHLGILW